MLPMSQCDIQRGQSYKKMVYVVFGGQSVSFLTIPSCYLLSPTLTSSRRWIPIQINFFTSRVHLNLLIINSLLVINSYRIVIKHLPMYCRWIPATKTIWKPTGRETITLNGWVWPVTITIHPHTAWKTNKINGITKQSVFMCNGQSIRPSIVKCD